MRLRRYEGATVTEALARVRADLGPDAVILHTRTSAEGGQGRESGARVQVMAALDEEPIATGPRDSEWAGFPMGGLRTTVRSSEDGDEPSPRREAADPGAGARRAGPARRESVEAERADEMLRLLRDVRDAAAPAPGVPASLRPLYQELRRREVESSLARRLVLGLPKNARGSAGGGRTRLRSQLGRRFQVRRVGSGRAGRRLVALVGPTGVGKTTTIAKLAGQVRAQGGLRIALMSLDTYRIGAVAQMRIYAELLQVPFHAVDTPEALAAALEAERDADLILLDTTGRSPGRPEEIEALTQLLGRIPRAEVHLVVSATTKTSDLEEVLNRFRPLAYRHVVITKLDEARTAGPVLGLALDRGLSISYLTAGQEVPDDLERATPTRLSALLLPDPPTRRSRRPART